MSYSASFQLKGLPNCQMSKFQVWKNGVAPVPLESNLFNELASNPKFQIFFWKVKLWHQVALLPSSLQVHTVPHFLQHNILKSVL